MRRTLLLPGLLAIVSSVALSAQQAQSPAAPPRQPSPSGMPQAALDEMLIRFPLPRGQEAYGNIDGRQMHKYVLGEKDYSGQITDHEYRHKTQCAATIT